MAGNAFTPNNDMFFGAIVLHSAEQVLISLSLTSEELKKHPPRSFIHPFIPSFL